MKKIEGRNWVSGKAIATICVIGLAGCSGNWKSIHHADEFESQEGKKSQVISVDAKQRFSVLDDLGNFCAEPSPDAMSALADAFGLNLSDPTSGISGNASGNSAESVASIGLRTQSIQLMRDAMYRICELEKNEGLSEISAYMLHSGYQDVMTALLAIEQLTGPVKASQATLSSESNTDLSQTINDLDELLAKLEKQKKLKEDEKGVADKAVAAAQEDKDKAQENFDAVIKTDDPSPSEEQVNTAKNALDESNVVLEEKTAAAKTIDGEISSLEQQIELAENTKSSFQTIQTNAKSTGKLEGGSAESNITDDSVMHIADSVVKIAEKAIDRDRVTPACLTFLTDKAAILIKSRVSYSTSLKNKDALPDNNDEIKDELDKTQSLLALMTDLCSDWLTDRAAATKLKLQQSNLAEMKLYKEAIQTSTDELNSLIEILNETQE